MVEHHRSKPTQPDYPSGCPTLYKMIGLMHPHAAGPHDPLPSMSTVLFHLLIHLFSYDLCFYSFHRLLHTKRFFPYHKKHHELKAGLCCNGVTVTEVTEIAIHLVS